MIGARTMQQLEDNLRTADLNLSVEELADLNDASRLNPVYPYRFLNELGARHV